MDGVLVRTIYRGMLKMSRDMGFKYGTRDNMMICDYTKISTRAIRRLIRTDRIGNFTANNIIYHHKIRRKETHTIGENLDWSFGVFRLLTEIREVYYTRKKR